MMLEPTLYGMLFEDLIVDPDNHAVHQYVYIPDATVEEIGVLSRMDDLFTDVLTADVLLEIDREYFTEHAAQKTPRRSCRTEFEYWLGNPSVGTYSGAREQLGEHMANTARYRFAQNWLRAYQTLFSDYKPIENYNMVENEDVGDKGSGKSDGNDLAKIYGANSLTGSPSNSAETHSETNTQNDRKRKLTRSGNIGVTTSQQMIESELALRRRDWVEDIFSDLDKLFCLEVFRI